MFEMFEKVKKVKRKGGREEVHIDHIGTFLSSIGWYFYTKASKRNLSSVST